MMPVTHGIANSSSIALNAWDIKSLNPFVLGDSFDFSSRTTSGFKSIFSPDGLSVFIMSVNFIYQYTLDIAWEINTANTYVGSFNITTGAAADNGFYFSADGLNFYVLGNNTNEISQYTLGTAWQITTTNAFVAGDFFTLSEGASHQDLFFSPDGLSIFELQNGLDGIFQYTLGTAWQINTTNAYVVGNFFSVTSQETIPLGMHLSPDGLNLYIVGNASDTIFQYTLGTAWQINTTNAFVAGDFFSVTNESTVTSGIRLSPDGLKAYVVGNDTNTVYQYRI